MSTVLVVAQVFGLWTVVGLVAFSLLIVELESAASAILFLQWLMSFNFTSMTNLLSNFSPHTSSTCWSSPSSSSSATGRSFASYPRSSECCSPDFPHHRSQMIHSTFFTRLWFSRFFRIFTTQNRLIQQSISTAWLNEGLETVRAGKTMQKQLKNRLKVKWKKWWRKFSKQNFPRQVGTAWNCDMRSKHELGQSSKNFSAVWFESSS